LDERDCVYECSSWEGSWTGDGVGLEGGKKRKKKMLLKD
jgi:hypothetical protein